MCDLVCLNWENFNFFELCWLGDTERKDLELAPMNLESKSGAGTIIWNKSAQGSCLTAVLKKSKSEEASI